MPRNQSQWQRINARELIERNVLCIGDGYRAKNSEMGPQGLPFARAGNINGQFLFDGADLLDEANIPRAGDKLSRASDVVFTSKGTVGRFAFVGNSTRRFVYSPQLCFWRVLDSGVLDARFLFYWMQSSEFLNQVQKVKGLTDMADYVSLSDQRRMDIAVPPLPAQRRIASVLGAYDDLIENNTRRIKILEEMAQMIYREWFVNFRFAGHENVKMVESELGPIPEGWGIAGLEQVCKRITDGSHWSPPSVPGTHRMASSKDMHRWGMDLSTSRTISEHDFESLVRNDCKPLAGDILITKDGANYLKFCFVIEKDLDVVLLSSIAMLRPDPDRVNPHFLAFYLVDPSVKARLACRVSGAAIPRIVLQDFRKFRVLRPPNEIQRGFDKFAAPIVGLCWRLIEKNANLRATRDLLLPKLISGEIPVEAAADAAAELTEQIA